MIRANRLQLVAISLIHYSMSLPSLLHTPNTRLLTHTSLSIPYWRSPISSPLAELRCPQHPRCSCCGISSCPHGCLCLPVLRGIATLCGTPVSILTFCMAGFTSRPSRNPKHELFRVLQNRHHVKESPRQKQPWLSINSCNSYHVF